jgi:hypothetical protein
MMNMAGIRFRGIGKPGDSSGEAVPLVNNSVFYRFSDYFTVGCELNNEIRSNGWITGSRLKCNIFSTSIISCNLAATATAGGKKKKLIGFSLRALSIPSRMK